MEINTIDDVRAALDASGRSQSELARFLGRDPSIVNRLIRGGRGLKVDELVRIRQFFSAAEAGGGDPARPRELPQAPVTLTQLPGGKARLELNLTLPFATALKILALVEEAQK